MNPIREDDKDGDKILMAIAGILFSAGLFITGAGIFFSSMVCIDNTNIINNAIKIGVGLMLIGVTLRAIR